MGMIPGSLEPRVAQSAKKKERERESSLSLAPFFCSSAIARKICLGSIRQTLQYLNFLSEPEPEPEQAGEQERERLDSTHPAVSGLDLFKVMIRFTPKGFEKKSMRFGIFE